MRAVDSLLNSKFDVKELELEVFKLRLKLFEIKTIGVLLVHVSKLIKTSLNFMEIFSCTLITS